jgi:hypothetical protein
MSPDAIIVVCSYDIFFSSIVVLTLNDNFWIVPLRHSVSHYSQILVIVAGGEDRSPYTNRTHTWIHMAGLVAGRNSSLLKMLIMLVYPVKLNPAFKKTQPFISIIVNVPQEVNRTRRAGIA